MGSACGKSSQPIDDSSAAPLDTPSKHTVDTAQTEQPKKVAMENATNNSSEKTVAPIEGEGELCHENLMPDHEAFDQVTDMDAPKQPRKMSSDVGNTAEAPSLPVGAQAKKRFRKRSVNITTLPDDQLAIVESIFDNMDKDKTGFISRQDVSRVLKDNYKPSEIEVQEVLQWMDTKGDGTVMFDEYTVAMASVMTKEGLREDADIEIARKALSVEMQRVAAEGAAVGKEGKMAANEDNIKNAATVIGQKNLQAMKERFNKLDVSNQGFLTQAEVTELIKLTYVAPEENITTFMRFFNEANKEGITREEFKHGLTLLYGDFTFVLEAQNYIVEAAAEATCEPGRPSRTPSMPADAMGVPESKSSPNA